MAFQAFSFDYRVRVRELRTPVTIIPAISLLKGPISLGGIPKGTPRYETEAIWDTGSTHSVISPLPVQSLDLQIVHKTEVRGVNGIHLANLFLVHILLPNQVLVLNVLVSQGNLNTDTTDQCLIGMDIISLEDLTISHADNQTFFSFYVPPLGRRIDLVEKGNYHNNKKNKQR